MNETLEKSGRWTWPVIRSAISSQALACGATRSAEPDGPITVPCGPDRALANLSALQAQLAGLLTSGTYGRHGSTLLKTDPPPVVFGEQVEAAIRHGWLDLVQADMEGIGYRFRPVGFPSAGVGAPHIRQRLWFVADTASTGSLGGWPGEAGVGRDSARIESQRFLPIGELGNNNNKGLERLGRGHQAEIGRLGEIRPVAETSESRELEHTESDGRIERRAESSERCVTTGCSACQLANTDEPCACEEREQRSGELGGLGGDHGDSEGHVRSTGPTNGYWRAADWLHCRDNKWRPVEPGTFPLAHGATSRVGRLRAYGNAINAEAAKEFIEAYFDVECEGLT